MRPKEFVKTREKEKKTATAISQEDKVTVKHIYIVYPQMIYVVNKIKLVTENIDL